MVRPSLTWHTHGVDGPRVGRQTKAGTMSRVHHRSLVLILFLSTCATTCSAPAETTLTSNVAVAGTTTKNQASFFEFTLGPYEDAEITLDVIDGDADVYVLGPMFARLSGFGPGPQGASAANVDANGDSDNFNSYTWAWSSWKSAGSDEVLYISSEDPLKAGTITSNRIFRVSVWGWSEFGESGADGSKWSISYVTRNHTEMVNNAAQKSAMQSVFDLCCSTKSNQCSLWKNTSASVLTPLDACHVRNNLCDENGVLRFVNFNDYGLTCDLSQVVTLLKDSVLPSITRLELNNNPGLTTGNRELPSATLQALLVATAANVTHLHLEAGPNLFAPNLTNTYAESNTFTSDVCAAFRARLTTLASIKMGNTGLKGQFPVGEDCLLGPASVDIEISDNLLTGAVPSWSGTNTLPKLLFYYVDGNEFTGSIPTRFATLCPLAVTLDFNYNELNGTLGDFGHETNQPALLFFKAAKNSLTGSVPGSLLGASSNVSGIDLSFNYLSGELPRDAFGGKRLTHVYLGSNALTGSIPDVMSSSEANDANSIAKDSNGISITAASYTRKLTAVDLSHNAFTGYGFPDALVCAHQLTYLYLNDNALTGDLPLATNGNPADLEWLIRFQKVRVLNLKNNRFTGFVPVDHLILDVFQTGPAATRDAATGVLTPLQHIYDVGNNKISGEAPAWVLRWREYTYITVSLENNLFACPIDNRILYLGLVCVDGDGSNTSHVPTTAADTGRRLPGDGSGSIRAGVTDPETVMSSNSIDESLPDDDAFFGLETAVGAGVFFCALLALGLLGHAALRVNSRRRANHRRFIEMEAFNDIRVDNNRREAWGDGDVRRM